MQWKILAFTVQSELNILRCFGVHTEMCDYYLFTSRRVLMRCKYRHNSQAVMVHHCCWSIHSDLTNNLCEHPQSATLLTGSQYGADCRRLVHVGLITDRQQWDMSHFSTLNHHFVSVAPPWWGLHDAEETKPAFSVMSSLNCPAEQTAWSGRKHQQAVTEGKEQN